MKAKTTKNYGEGDIKAILGKAEEEVSNDPLKELLQTRRTYTPTYTVPEEQGVIEVKSSTSLADYFKQKQRTLFFIFAITFPHLSALRVTNA